MVGGEAHRSAHRSARCRGGCTQRMVEASSGVACWWRADGGSDKVLGGGWQWQQPQGTLKPGQGKVLPGWWAAGVDEVVS